MTEQLIQIKCDCGYNHWVKYSDYVNRYRTFLPIYHEDGTPVVWGEKLVIAGEPVEIKRTHIVEVAS